MVTVAHYIYEVDPADQVMDDYSVICRSDTAAWQWQATVPITVRLLWTCGKAKGTLLALTR